jgi:hypothetical protein
MLYGWSMVGVWGFIICVSLLKALSRLFRRGYSRPFGGIRAYGGSWGFCKGLVIIA